MSELCDCKTSASLQNSAMAHPQNAIRAIRQKRNLTQEALGMLLGMTKHQISRLEKGDTELTVDVARRAARSLGVTLDELIGETPAIGFAEDLAPYEADAADPLRAALVTSDNIYLFTVENDALNRAGYTKGMILQISDARLDCSNVKPLQAVRVLYHPPASVHKAVSLLRQYVPPRTLITNSSTANMPNIDMDIEDAHIVGVVVGGYKRFTA